MKDRQISHYRILEKLGAGGMGEVWLAEDTRLERKVALKFLPHFAAQDETEKARFIQEAKAAAKLSHANIAQVYEIGEEQERLYIVMEYVSGGSLRDVLDDAKGRSLPLEKVLTWVQQTAEGLAEAHSHGIIHRDIKPDNLMLTEKGQIKITDFGLARLETATRLTASGTTLGTVNYMSPELITGKDVDHRSDLFSLGATFYELLTGQQAFTGQDANSTYYAILNAPVDPPGRFRKDVSDKLEEIVDKLLDRDPSLRYQTASGVVADLRRYLVPGFDFRGPGVWSRLLGRNVKWIQYSALGAAVGALVMLVALSGHRNTIDLSDNEYVPFAVDIEWEGRGVWSPDGRSIAYLKKINRGNQIVVCDLVPGARPRTVTSVPSGVNELHRLTWSAECDRLYFVSDDTLWSISPLGGEPSLVEDRVWLAALSPDGKTWAFWGPDGLTVSSPPDIPRRPYEPFPFVISGNVPRYLSFSPDGKNIGFSKSLTRAAASASTADQNEAGSIPFWIFPWPDGPSVEPYQPFPANIPEFQYAPSFDWMDSKRVLLSRGTSGFWMGNIRSSRLDRMTVPADNEYFPSISPDGKSILFNRSNTDYDIVEVSLDGSPPRYLIKTEMGELSPSWSWNGDRLSYITNRRGRYEIWLRTIGGTSDQPIVTPDDFSSELGTIHIGAPAIISPDGQSVAYRVDCDKSEWNGIWYSHVEGRRPFKAFPEGIAGYSASWSPGGDKLVGSVYTGQETEWDLAVVNTGNPDSYHIIYEPYVENPLWSPDGRWIAAIMDEQVHILSEDPAVSPLLWPNPVTYDWDQTVTCWSRDGETLYIASSRLNESCIYALDILSGVTQKIADLDPELIFGQERYNTMFGSLNVNGTAFVTTAMSQKSDIFILNGLLDDWY